MGEVLVTSARLLLYVGALVGIGAPLAIVMQGSAWRARLNNAERRREVLAWSAVVVALALMLIAQFRALEMAPTRETLALVLGRTTWGQGWSVLLLTAVMGVTLSTTRAATWARVAAAFVLAAAMSGLGHAAADDTVWLARAIDALHVASIGAWLGALVCLSPELSQQAWSRFSRVATVVAPIAVATGVGSAWRRLPDWSVLIWPASPYVWLLAVKVALVLVVLALGAAHRRHVHTKGAPTRGSVRVELLLGFAVLIVTAVLTGTSPPGE